MLGASLYFASQTSPGSMGMMAVSLSFSFLSSLVSVFVYFSQGRTYAKAMSERQNKYRALLQSQRDQLLRLADQQRSALCQMNPSSDENERRVTSRDRSLWERAPKDEDFLSLRLGVGQQPLRVQIKAPRQEGAIDVDPLVTEAIQLAAELGQVNGQPVLFSLLKTNSTGLIGGRAQVLNAVRSLCQQLVTHHSPDEVKVAAIFPHSEEQQWSWIRWLPHTWSDDRGRRFLADSREGAHELLASLDSLLSRRRQALAMSPDNQARPLPLFVVILGDPSLVEKEPILPVLLREGSRLGAVGVFLADRIDDLPKGCDLVAELAPDYGRVIETGPQAGQQMFAPDLVPPEVADRFARAMAPIELARLADSSEIPNSVSLLELLGGSTVEELDIGGRWKRNDPSKTLSTPLGLRAGSKVQSLDLHEKGHGPHGLVAGTTGSGKSELLLALLVSLAASYHPHEVVFVVVDYKGGSTANSLAALPHMVGTITNLQGNLATRALFALKAEVERRQAVLAQHGLTQVDQYLRKRRAGEVKDPLPHLVIVMDEFAELATGQPEFMRELMSVVRLGRALGVHLILATQKPAGVVNEQIWSNSRFRICLRVERPEDSQEVLKQPDAASITRPGRAYLQVGMNEVFELFQSGFGGAPYLPGGAAPGEKQKLLSVELDGSRRELRLSPRPMVIQSPTTQLQAMVQEVAEEAKKEGVDRLPGPWLAPLPDHVSLDELLSGRGGWNGRIWRPGPWMEATIGMADDPRHQWQGPLRVSLAKEGHLAIYGAPGTGKTTLLQTLITSLVLAHPPDEVNLYLLDFGGRLLKLFEPLPHVGGVVLADDAERLERLLRFLSRELESRKERFGQAGVATLESYRRATHDLIPAIVLAIDNYNSFSSTYPDADDEIARLAREGGNLGLHLVLTASSVSAIKTKVSGNITHCVALQLADRGEYGVTVGRTDGLEPAPLPGRGLVKGSPPLEFQGALPVRELGETQRTAALKTLTQTMDAAWKARRARPIPVLPDVVPLSDLVPPTDQWPSMQTEAPLAVPVGVDVEVLDPVMVDLNEGPHFLITGSSQSGKTSFLQTWLLALAEHFPPERLQLFLVDFRQTGMFALQNLPHTRMYITSDESLNEQLTALSEQMQMRRRALAQARRDAGGTLDERQFLSRYPALVLAIDDLRELLGELQETTKARLEQMLRREKGMGLHILVAETTSDIAGGWDGVVKVCKELQCGFLFGTTDQDALRLFNAKLPYGEADKVLPPGQGVFARRGRLSKLKAATAQAGQISLANQVERLRKRPRSSSEQPR